MKISYLTDEALYTLRAQLPDNVECYASGDLDFFYDLLENIDGLRTERRFDFPDFELDITPDFGVSDTLNVRILYSAMKSLPPSIASDERLWSGLAHGLFWDYVQYRQADKIATKEARKIAPSFFFTNGHRRSLYVNCLSRLWWAGYLTYDESNEQDPFALTTLVTENAFPSTIVILSSSNMTANHDICLGVLDSIQKRKQGGERIVRDHFSKSLHYLNNMGAITLLDTLSRSEITAIVDEYFNTDEFASLIKSRRKNPTEIDAEPEFFGMANRVLPVQPPENETFGRPEAISSADELPIIDDDTRAEKPSDSSYCSQASEAEETNMPALKRPPDTAPEDSVTNNEPASFSKRQREIISAANYYVDYSGYSFDMLVAQLVEIGFTENEAVFGAEHSKADWMQEAVETANQWIEFMNPSREELKKQLTDDGFTPIQVEYGLAYCDAEWNKSGDL